MKAFSRALFLTLLIAAVPAFAGSEGFDAFLGAVPSATPTGAELIPCVQGGVTKSCTAAQIAALAGGHWFGFNSYTNLVTGNQTCYLPFTDNTCGATENERYFAAPTNATFTTLVCATTVAPGTGNTVTISLRISGADPTSALTCTFSGASTTPAYSGSSNAISAGQSYDLKVVSSTSAASTTLYGGVIFTTP